MKSAHSYVWSEADFVVGPFFSSSEQAISAQFLWRLFFPRLKKTTSRRERRNETGCQAMLLTPWDSSELQLGELDCSYYIVFSPSMAAGLGVIPIVLVVQKSILEGWRELDAFVDFNGLLRIIDSNSSSCRDSSLSDLSAILFCLFDKSTMFWKFSSSILHRTVSTRGEFFDNPQRLLLPHPYVWKLHLSSS